MEKQVESTLLWIGVLGEGGEERDWVKIRGLFSWGSFPFPSLAFPSLPFSSLCISSSFPPSFPLLSPLPPSLLSILPSFLPSFLDRVRSVKKWERLGWVCSGQEEEQLTGTEVWLGMEARRWRSESRKWKELILHGPIFLSVQKEGRWWDRVPKKGDEV